MHMVARYIPVTMHMTRSALKKDISGTFAGMLWWIIEPLFYTFIYYFLFAVIFEVRSENFALMLLFGLILWRWIALCINSGSSSVVARTALMRQVDIPKIIFPVESVLRETIKFLIGFGLIAAVFLVFGYLSFEIIYWFPVILGLSVFFLTSLVLITSVIMTFVPDLKNLIRLGMRALVFVSGVFFTPEQVPENLRTLFMMNPFAVIIDSFRRVCLFGEAPILGWLIYVLGLSVILASIGLYMHIKYNRIMPRYLI